MSCRCMNTTALSGQARQDSALLDKGCFTVDEIERRGTPDTLTIRGRSADFRGMLNSRREQSWYDSTLGIIVETIAARNMLTASVADALKAIPVPHIDQAQESDAVFLSRLADRNGLGKRGETAVYQSRERGDGQW